MLLVAIVLTGAGATAAAAPPEGTIVFALGDGADGSRASRALADYVVSQDPDRFFYLGDVYERGTAREFATRYEPLYGRLAAITDPVVGNHEFRDRAVGFSAYWKHKRGWSASPALRRSYVDARSGWQVIAYSSESDPQVESQWVARQLAKHGGTCRIAIAHRGRHVVVDTAHDDNVDQQPVWTQLAGRVAINLVGHNHVYGRLAPIRGVTVLVSGAGGHALRSLGHQHHAVRAAKTRVPTATRLVLTRGRAEFTQVGANGAVYDSGTIGCGPAS